MFEEKLGWSYEVAGYVPAALGANRKAVVEVA